MVCLCASRLGFCIVFQRACSLATGKFRCNRHTKRTSERERERIWFLSDAADERNTLTAETKPTRYFVIQVNWLATNQYIYSRRNRIRNEYTILFIFPLLTLFIVGADDALMRSRLNKNDTHLFRTEFTLLHPYLRSDIAS